MANPTMQVTLELDDKGSVKLQKFGRRVGKLDGRLKTVGSKLGAGAKMMGRFGGQAATAAGKVTGLVGGLAGLVSGLALKGAVTEFANFESALANVSTLVDTSKVSMEKLKQGVMALPPELGSATENVNALYQAISAGVAPAEALKVVEESARAAKAGLTDTFTAVDAGTTVMNAFGMDVGNLAGVFDQFFTTVKEGKTTFPELAAAIGKVAPMASAAGVATEELFAALATLTKGGISTRESVTYLRSALSNIVKPSKQATDLAEELGIQFSAAALKSQGLAGFLEQVKTATGGNIEKMSQLFGSTEALQSILALTGTQAGEFSTILGKMETSAGATDKAFGKQVGTLNQLWEAFKNAFGKQAALIGEKLAPAIKDLLGGITDWVSKNKELIATKLGGYIKTAVTEIKKLGPKIGELVAKLGRWFSSNEKVLQQGFAEFVRGAVEAVSALVENINLVLVPLKALAKVFDTAGKAIGYALHKTVQFAKAIKDIASKPLKMVMEFFGKGSSEKPITEKIVEIKSGLYTIADSWDQAASRISARVPSIRINIQQAEAAIGRLMKKTRKLINNRIMYAYGAVDWDDPVQSYYGQMKMRDVRAWADKMREQAAGQAAAVRDYWGGPMAAKAGSRTYNINVQPTFMSGDRAAARAVAEELKKELEEAGYRWG